MSLTLHVDGAKWRAAQDAALAANPSLVPVIKGNGYGFGQDLLCAEAGRLGVSLIAVGTYAEVPGALATFAADILVMEPFRGSVDSALPDLGNPVSSTPSPRERTWMRSGPPTQRRASSSRGSPRWAGSAHRSRRSAT